VNARLFEEPGLVGFAVAYRMLGSVSRAKDIVQEAFLRLHGTLADGGRIESPRAYWRGWSPGCIGPPELGPRPPRDLQR
jgi:DNA-directed RNA polymerase specialized sigma24 family protein